MSTLPGKRLTSGESWQPFLSCAEQTCATSAVARHRSTDSVIFISPLYRSPARPAVKGGSSVGRAEQAKRLARFRRHSNCSKFYSTKQPPPCSRQTEATASSPDAADTSVRAAALVSLTGGSRAGLRKRTANSESLLSLESVNARDGFLSVIEMMQQSARLMGIFMPGRGLFGDWPELDNKIEAFRLFQSADRELRLPVDRTPLDEVVERTLAADTFRAIWMLEGVGYIKGTASSRNVKGLLIQGPGSRLPDRAMIPLHAGMGTAFGEKLFGELGSYPSESQIRDTVHRFLELCRTNCRPGWEDACIESAG